MNSLLKSLYLLFLISCTLPSYSQDCGNLYEPLDINIELTPTGPYAVGDMIDVLLSIDNFQRMIEFRTALQWDPSVLCINPDQSINNPETLVGFPLQLAFPITTMANDLLAMQQSGILQLGWFDAMGLGDGSTSAPDGTPMVRISFIVCGGPLECTEFKLVPDFNHSSTHFVDIANTCKIDSINLITDASDEVCIVCGAGPTLIDEAICVNQAGEWDVNFSVCGANAPFTWRVLGGGPDGTIANSGDDVNFTLPPGDWELIVTDAMGNSLPFLSGVYLASDFIPLTVSLLPGSLNCNNSTTEIDYRITGGDTILKPLMYDVALSTGEVKFNSELFETFDRLGSGTYTVTVTDIRGCQATAETTLNAPPPMELLYVEVDSATCLGANDGAVRIVVGGGTPFPSDEYRFGNSATPTDTFFLDNINLFSDTCLNITAFDQLACQLPLCIPIPLKNDINFTHELTPTLCGNPGWSSTITVLDPEGHSWTLRDSDTFETIASVSTNQSFFTQDDLLPGNYTWLVVNQVTGCRIDFDFVVLDTTAPAISLLDVSTSADCGMSNGVAEVMVSGGTMPLNYEWADFPLETGPSVSNLAGGSYSVTVTDDVGCSDEITLDLAGTSFLTIEEAFVRDSLDCTDPTRSAVLQVIFNSSPDFTISWFDAGGQFVGSDPTLITDIPGDYTVEISLNGTTCIETVVVNLPQVVPFTFDLNKVDPINCGPNARDGEVRVDNILGGSGNYDFEWTVRDRNGNLLPIPTVLLDLMEEEFDFGPALTTGNSFTVVVEDLDTGCKETATVTLASNDDVLFMVDPTPPSCPGFADGVISIVGTGLTCDLVDPITMMETPIPGCFLDGISAGDYIIRILDGSCSRDSLVKLEDAEIFTAELMDISDPTCNGLDDGTATVVITDNPSLLTTFFYSWNGETAMSGTGMITNFTLTAGDNNVIVGDGVCQDTLDFDLIEPDAISILPLSGISVTCPGSCDGQVTIKPSGGTVIGDYEFLWTDGDRSQTRNDLCPGINYVTISDDNGCMHLDSVIVSEADSIFLSATVINLGCENVAQGGSITVAAVGGCGNYTYDWPTYVNSTDAMATGLDIGTYVLTVTDDCGCSEELSSEIGGNQPPSGSAFLEGTPLCDGDRVCLGVDPASVTGGNGIAYEYNVNINLHTAIPLDSCVMVPPGTYIINLFDSDGCPSIRPDTIIVPEAPDFSVDLGPDLALELGDSDVEIIAEIISSFPLDTIIWSGDSEFDCLVEGCGTIQVYPTTNSFMSVTVIDENGCRRTDDLLIDLDSPRRVFIPNMFAPGSGTAEDRFMIQTGRGVKSIVDFNIYDRWGNLMFALPDDAKEHPTSRDDGWDGRKQNRNCEQGVYVWIANVLYLDNKVITYKGHVTLLRQQ